MNRDENRGRELLRILSERTVAETEFVARPTGRSALRGEARGRV